MQYLLGNSRFHEQMARENGRKDCTVAHAVQIELGLRPASPQNGNIRGRGRRLSAVGAGRTASWESGDEAECVKSTYLRPNLVFLGERSPTLECLAGDAVHIAPVSSQIPCKQGILQGKSRFQASERRS